MHDALYARLSKKQKGSVSVPAQLRGCRERAERDGSTSLVEYADTKSASDRARRPEFDRLMRAVKAGQVGKIYCRDMDRFLRQIIEGEEILRVIMQTGVRVIFTHDTEYNLNTADGRDYFRVAVQRARREVEKKSERQKISNEERAREGLPYASGRTGFGHQRDGGRLVVVPAERDAITAAYDKLFAGGTMTGVAAAWNAEGHHTRYGKPFTGTDIKTVLLNPRIAGLRRYAPSSVLYDTPASETLYPGTWEAIVTPERQEALRRLLGATRSPAGNRLRWLGGGIYLCGTCGVPVHTHQSRNSGSPVRTYRCWRNARYDGCGKIFGKADEVDAYVELQTKRLLAHPEIYRANLQRDGGPDVAALIARKQDLEDDLASIVEDFAAGGIPRGAYRKALDTMNAKIAEIDTQLASVEDEAASADSLAEMRNAAEAWEWWESAELTQRRQMLGTLYSRIVLTSLPVGYHARFAKVEDRVTLYLPSEEQWNPQYLGMPSSPEEIEAGVRMARERDRQIQKGAP